MNVNSAINTASQTPAAANNPLTFATTQASAGTAITHTPSSADFTLTENGTYQISYNSIVTTSGSASPPVAVSLQLARGGAAIDGTKSTATLAAAGNNATLSGTAVLTIADAPQTITLISDSTDGAFTNTTMTIRKLD